MIDWPPDEARLPPLGTMLAEFASADAPRRGDLLAAIIRPVLENRPKRCRGNPGADRLAARWGPRDERKVCYALSNYAPASVAPPSADPAAVCCRSQGSGRLGAAPALRAVVGTHARRSNCR